MVFLVQQLQKFASHVGMSQRQRAYSYSEQLQLTYNNFWEIYCWGQCYYDRMAASASTTPVVDVEAEATTTLLQQFWSARLPKCCS